MVDCVLAVAVLAAGTLSPGRGSALTPAPASASPPAPFEAAPVLDEGAPTAHPLVSLQWAGDLRVRGERWSGVRWSLGNPGPLHPLLRHGAATSGLSDGSAVHTTDLRLRLEPTLHVAEWSQVHAQLDLGLGAGVPLGGDTATFLGGSAQGDVGSETGAAPVRGGFGVRRLWLTAKLIGMADLELGRTPDHFGMGLVRNAGGGFDGDFQSDVDRIALQAELFGFQFKVARDWLAGWLPEPASAPGGVAMPLQDSADVVRWVFEAGGDRPATDRGLRWGAALLYTTQEVGHLLEHVAPDAAQGAQGECLASGRSVDPSCQGLLPRTARFFTSQGALDWKLGRLHAELEAAFVYGTVGITDERRETASAKSWLSGGAAGRLAWREHRRELRLDAGFATGENSGGFGVLDTNNFRTGPGQDDPQRATMTGFRFHRGLRVDGLLFRDLIGSVANAVYARPALRWHLHEGAAGDGLWVEPAVLMAVAASPEATPGRARWLGVEPEFTARWRAGTTELGLRATFLLPGGALAAEDGSAAQAAWRVEAGWRATW